MPRRFLIMAAMALVLSVAPAAAQAQTGPAPTEATSNDIDRFAFEYTEAVMLGVVAGGIVMNLLSRSHGASMAGALIGSSLASWLFVNLQARHYVIRRAGLHPSH